MNAPDYKENLGTLIRTIYDFAFVTYADLPRGPIKNNSMRRLAATTLLDILPPKIADRYIALEEICKLKLNYLFWKFFEHDTSWAKTSSNGVQLNWIFSGWIRRWRRILTALTTSWRLLAWSLTTDLGRRTNFGNDYLLPSLLSLTFDIHPLSSLCCGTSVTHRILHLLYRNKKLAKKTFCNVKEWQIKILPGARRKVIENIY